MTKEWLQARLAEGLSLERIGELAGRHPSTVAYHLRKHGLTAAGQSTHSNGKVDPERVRAVIDDGATIREAAAELGVGYTTVRYWIHRLGLETQRMRRLRDSRMAAAKEDTLPVMSCSTHGRGVFVMRSDGSYRCRQCRIEAVTERRRRVKRLLVERAGGACRLCGYDRHDGALQFHHLDRAAKEFHLSRHGVTRAFEEAVAEAEKCILLCANCHAEVEAGVVGLPAWS